MAYKISKELFEAVMKINTEVFFVKDNNIHYGVKLENSMLNSFPNFINIDTFFFKCKEWALGQGYVLHSSIDEMGKGYLKVDEFNEELYGQSIKTFTEDSEQQTVFDACQWILDIKDKQ